MFQNFSERCKLLIMEAELLARNSRNLYIYPEHITIILFKNPSPTLVKISEEIKLNIPYFKNQLESEIKKLPIIQSKITDIKIHENTHGDPKNEPKGTKREPKGSQKESKGTPKVAKGTPRGAEGSYKGAKATKMGPKTDPGAMFEKDHQKLSKNQLFWEAFSIKNL